MRAYMMTCMKAIKTKEGNGILSFSPRKKEDEKPAITKGVQKIEQPNNGREFFFSNVLMKIYQVPVTFLANSEDEYSKNESTFICLYYEKSMRKRTYAKTAAHKQRLQRM